MPKTLREQRVKLIEKKMKQMARIAREQGVNRKMNSSVKGPRSGLNRIKIPMDKYKWFYSKTTKEIYKYDQGVFEVHSPYSAQPSLQPTHPTQFYGHHHLKVPPNDITPATVMEGTTFHELTAIFLPCKIWQEVTAPKK